MRWYEWFAIIFAVGTIAFIGFTYAATNKEKVDALNNGVKYLVESDGSVWNASDFTAIAYFSKKYPTTVLPGGVAVDLKKKFNPDQYAFTSSLLKQSLVSPSDFELSLGSPAWYYKIYSCEDISSADFTKLSGEVNSKDDPYAATHAVFFLDQIADTYALNCGKGSQANTAESLKAIVANGLQLNEATINIPGGYDAYLSQECARGLVTGQVQASVVDLVVKNQDLNSLEPLTFGGWYSSRVRLNEPHTNPIFQQDKKNSEWYEVGSEWVYPELPNGHTTSMALCLLLIDLGVSQ